MHLLGSAPQSNSLASNLELLSSLATPTKPSPLPTLPNVPNIGFILLSSAYLHILPKYAVSLVDKIERSTESIILDFSSSVKLFVSI